MLKAYLKKMILPTVVMVWAFTYYLECLNYKLKSRRMIVIVFFMMLGLYVINGITDFFEVRKEIKNKKAEATETEEKAEKKSLVERFKKSSVLRMVAIFAILILYVLVLDTAGFIITTLVCSELVLLVMGERKWYVLVFMPIVLVAVLYLIFRFGLKVPLPKGFINF
ncbi:MAG: tripartite tricarboxylate transporter TctB family protein [Clostridia bacterium]|nr:tripartite tricarboxylate transporter TctB family protein [Clostridia bacterium]